MVVIEDAAVAEEKAGVAVMVLAAGVVVVVELATPCSPWSPTNSCCTVLSLIGALGIWQFSKLSIRNSVYFFINLLSI